MMHAQETPQQILNSLTLKGNVKYSIQEQRVLIEIDEISNQAEAGLLSGTLALELWALPAPYQGSGFSGFALASTTIGELKSQHSLFNCQYDLIFNEPPEGNWHLVLMLREWNGQGYVTCDYVNFVLPYYQAPKPLTVSEIKPSKVIHLAFDSGTQNTVESKPAQAGKVKLAGKAKKQILHDAAPAEKDTLKKSASAKAKTKAGATQKLKGPELLVKINRASKAELAAIKGIHSKLAEDIVSSQPFADLKTLQSVKGLGKKKLEALTQSLIK